MMNVKDHIALVENAFPEEVVDGFLSYYKLSVLFLYLGWLLTHLKIVCHIH